MAPYVLLDSKLWVDGFDMSGYKNRIAVDGPLALRDHTRFNDTGRRRAAGLKAPTLRAAGFWDTASTTFEPDKPYFDRLGSEVPVSCAPQDGLEGSVGYFFRAMEGRYELGASIGEMLGFTVDAEGSDGVGLIRGTIIGNKNVAAGGPTNGTVFQLGQVGAGQTLYAVLHALQVGTSIDVKIQSDDAGGFGTPTDRITFAQKLAIGSEYKTLAGPIAADDRWRIVFTTVGAPNAKFIVLLGIR
jgi:hypothetical protein